MFREPTVTRTVHSMLHQFQFSLGAPRVLIRRRYFPSPQSSVYVGAGGLRGGCEGWRNMPGEGSQQNPRAEQGRAGAELAVRIYLLSAGCLEDIPIGPYLLLRRSDLVLMTCHWLVEDPSYLEFIAHFSFMRDSLVTRNRWHPCLLTLHQRPWGFFCLAPP